MSGEMCHVELFADDLERAKQFYDGLFDWEFIELNISNAPFVRWKVCCGLSGIFRRREAGAPDDLPGPINYIAVDDIESVCSRITELGGNVIYLSPELMAGGPRLGLFADPDGNILGLWQTIKADKAEKK